MRRGSWKRHTSPLSPGRLWPQIPQWHLPRVVPTLLPAHGPLPCCPRPRLLRLLHLLSKVLGPCPFSKPTGNPQQPCPRGIQGWTLVAMILAYIFSTFSRDRHHTPNQASSQEADGSALPWHPLLSSWGTSCPRSIRLPRVHTVTRWGQPGFRGNVLSPHSQSMKGILRRYSNQFFINNPHAWPHYVFRAAVKWSGRMIIYSVEFLQNEFQDRSNRKL